MYSFASTAHSISTKKLRRNNILATRHSEYSFLIQKNEKLPTKQEFSLDPLMKCHYCRSNWVKCTSHMGQWHCNVLYQYYQYITLQCDLRVLLVHYTAMWSTSITSTLCCNVIYQYYQYITLQCDLPVLLVHYTAMWSTSTTSTLRCNVIYQYYQYIMLQCDLPVLPVHYTAMWSTSTTSTLHCNVIYQYY